MEIVNLLKNANLTAMLARHETGRYESHINYLTSAKNKEDVKISVASMLQSLNTGQVGINVTFPDGLRNKKLDIVFIKNSHVQLILLSKRNEYDYKASDLDNLIHKLKKEFAVGFFFSGVVIIYNEESHQSDLPEKINQYHNISSQFINKITITNLYQINKKNGLFN